MKAAATKPSQVGVKTGNKGGRKLGVKMGSYMPMPQQVRVIQKYVGGKSMRQIAKEEHKDETSIARVVKSEEMQAYCRSLMEKILGRCGEKLVTRIEHEIEDFATRNGAWVAMELAERFGAIPPKIQRQATVIADAAGLVGGTMDSSSPDFWLTKFVLAAREKGKVFGTRLPDVETVMSKEERKEYEEELAREQEP
jgi:hypothetical protein